MFVHNAFYAAVDDKSRANGAGLVRAIKRCAVNRNAEFRRLNDCVLFGVYGIAFFCASAAFDPQSVAHAIAFVAAIEYACGRAVVTRRQNALVLDDNCAYGSALTGATCPRRHKFRHIHETFVPVVHICTVKKFYFQIDNTTKYCIIQQGLWKNVVKFKKNIA